MMDRSGEAMVFEEFRDRFDVDANGCWIWRGYVNPDGYAHVYVRESKRKERVHRRTYEFANGPIPEGLVIDHLCRVRRCVNPDHLEAVTHQVNILRGEGIPAENSKKTHCPYGHRYDDKNTIIRSVRSGRECVVCLRRRHREYGARNREARAAYKREYRQRKRVTDAK